MSQKGSANGPHYNGIPPPNLDLPVWCFDDDNIGVGADRMHSCQRVQRLSLKTC